MSLGEEGRMQDLNLLTDSGVALFSKLVFSLFHGKREEATHPIITEIFHRFHLICPAFCGPNEYLMLSSLCVSSALTEIFRSSVRHFPKQKFITRYNNRAPVCDILTE
jgi:hypothetical protein